MSTGSVWRVFLAPLFAALTVGCEWGNQALLARYHAENQRLHAASQSQVFEIESLNTHCQELASQLADAEEELVLLGEQLGRHGPSLALNRPQDPHTRVGRLPAEGGVQDRLIHVRGQLSELAKRHPSLSYDAETGISKLDADILFQSGDDTINAEARLLLADLAAVLRSSQAEPLKVIVAGHTDNQRIRGRETRDRFPNNWHLSGARALVVAEYLQAQGVDGRRMGLASFGPYQPIAANDSPRSRRQNRRVEIFVTSPDVPIVGMTETVSNLH